MGLQTLSFDNDVFTAGKIVCVGRNYVEHIQELNNDIPDEIVFFLKPASAVSNILHAYKDEPLHYETELCFLVEEGRFVAVAVGLDITKRALQSRLKDKGLPWERAKAFDGSAVFSPFVSLPKISDDLRIELEIDQKLIQFGGVSLMIHKPDEILAELSTFMSLNDGDIVMTGTPKGVGVIEKNAVFNARVIQGDRVLTSMEWVAE